MTLAGLCSKVVFNLLLRDSAQNREDIPLAAIQPSNSWSLGYNAATIPDFAPAQHPRDLNGHVSSSKPNAP